MIGSLNPWKNKELFRCCDWFPGAQHTSFPAGSRFLDRWRSSDLLSQLDPLGAGVSECLCRRGLFTQPRAGTLPGQQAWGRVLWFALRGYQLLCAPSNQPWEAQRQDPCSHLQGEVKWSVRAWLTQGSEDNLGSLCPPGAHLWIQAPACWRVDMTVGCSYLLSTLVSLQNASKGLVKLTG